MTDWLDDYAAALGDPSYAPTGPDKNRLLELARDVAHGTERKNAPLAAFIVGRYLATHEGASIDEAIAVARRLLDGAS